VSDVTRLRPFLEGNQWYTRPGSMPTRLKATHLAQKNRHIACDIASDRGSVFIDDILPHTRVVEVDGVEIRYADPMLLLVQKIITYAERGAGMEAKLAVDLADINFCIEQLLPDQHPVSATLQATYLKEETRHAFLERLPPQNKHHYIELLRFVGIEVGIPSNGLCLSKFLLIRQLDRGLALGFHIPRLPPSRDCSYRTAESRGGRYTYLY
jgi:hypothetical protein